MLSSPSSTRALDAIVRDLASFSIRQQQAQAFFRQCRKFSSLELPAISQHNTLPKPTSESSTPATRTRAENRKLRMLRRVQLGTYRPSAEARKDADSGLGQDEPQEVPQEEDIVTSALQKIDALEGPSVTLKTTNKTSRPNSKTAKQDSKPAEQPKVQPKKSKRERWMCEKEAQEKKFGEQGWQPRKRLSPDTLEGLRALHASDPTTYTTPVLAQHFQITPEAIRRILKSKWKPDSAEIEDRMKRWEKRGLKKWEDMAAQGIKPPKKWRDMGAGNPVLEKKVAKKMSKADKIEARWKEIAEQAQRLPMEGSLAERIL